LLSQFSHDFFAPFFSIDEPPLSESTDEVIYIGVLRAKLIGGHRNQGDRLHGAYDEPHGAASLGGHAVGTLSWPMYLLVNFFSSYDIPPKKIMLQKI
jgi:hypothetical protein